MQMQTTETKTPEELISHWKTKLAEKQLKLSEFLSKGNKDEAYILKNEIESLKSCIRDLELPIKHEKVLAEKLKFEFVFMQTKERAEASLHFIGSLEAFGEALTSLMKKDAVIRNRIIHSALKATDQIK